MDEDQQEDSEDEEKLVIGKSRRAFSFDSAEQERDILTGIIPIDVALKGLYQAVRDVTGRE